VIATHKGLGVNLSLVVDGKEAPRASACARGVSAFQDRGGAVAHPERSEVVLLASARSAALAHDREGEAGGLALRIVA